MPSSCSRQLPPRARRRRAPRRRRRSGPGPSRRTAACALYLAHVACAFHFYHDWSHESAYRQVERESEELLGVEIGGRLYLNYVFTLVWCADVVRVWIRGNARDVVCTRLLHSFMAFMAFHRHRRPEGCPLTMMTFDTSTPETCGVVEMDRTGVVVGFHEKVADPPGTRANGAVYLLEPEILDWLTNRPDLRDFSTEVLPNFVGSIATWHNDGIHRDIGTPEMLALAQHDPVTGLSWTAADNWSYWFRDHPVHREVADLTAACGPMR